MRLRWVFGFFLFTFLGLMGLYAAEKPCDQALRNPWPEFESDGRKHKISVKTDPVYGDSFYVLTTEQVDSQTGKVQRSTRQISKDARTGSIQASSYDGELLLQLMISHVQKTGGRATFVFIDVNNLGLVNHFVGNHVSGDLYLERIGAAIHDSLRDLDVTFRIAGDEFVILIPEAREGVVLTILNRIQQRINRDKVCQSIFMHQREYLRSHLEQRLQGLSSRKQKKLWLEVNRRTLNFAERKENLLKIFPDLDPELLEVIQKIDQADRLKPTVSIGSTLIGLNDDFISLKERASGQAGLVKKEYKANVGLDSSNYGMSHEDFNPSELMEHPLDEIFPKFRQPLPPPQN